MVDSFIVCMVQLSISKHHKLKPVYAHYVIQTVTALSNNQHVENPVEKYHKPFVNLCLLIVSYL